MRRIAELTPQEVNFCKLRAQGLDQTTAYLLSHDKPDIKQKSATELASRLAAKPQVLAMMRELYRDAKKSHLLSHAEWLSMMIDAFHQSMTEGNKTAAASFGRLMGGGIGALSENIHLSNDRPDADALVNKIAGDDPKLAALLRKRLSARDTFDA